MKVPKNRFRDDDDEEWIDWDGEGSEGEEGDEEYARRLLRKEKHLRKRKKLSDPKELEGDAGEGKGE